MYRTPARRRLFFTPGSSAKRFRAASTPAFTPGATDGAAISGHRTLNRTSSRGVKRTGTLKAQVKSLQTWVKKHNPEVKYFDVDISCTNLTSAGFVVPINAVTQGVTGATRVGTEINVTAVSLRIKLIAATDSTSRFHCRVVLLVDKDQISSFSTSAGAFADGVFSGDPCSMLPSTSALNRFRVLAMSELKDNAMGFNANIDTGVTQSNVIELNWKGNLKCKYTTPTGNAMLNNTIYVLYMTDSTAGTMDFSGVSRLQFTDA